MGREQPRTGYKVGKRCTDRSTSGCSTKQIIVHPFIKENVQDIGSNRYTERHGTTSNQYPALSIFFAFSCSSRYAMNREDLFSRQIVNRLSDHIILTACNMLTAMFKLVGCPLIMINRSPGLTGPPGVAGVPGSVTRT